MIDAGTRTAWALGCAGLAGAAALGWQIAWYRIHSFASGGTLETFGIYLAVYLAGLGAGARWAQAQCEGHSRRSAEHAARKAAQAGLGAGLVAYAHTPLAAWGATFGAPEAGLALVALAAAQYGAILPLVCHASAAPDARAGRDIARIYLANIAGACTGATLTGFVLLDGIGTDATAVVGLGATTALALAVRAGAGGTRRARAKFATVAVGASALALTAHGTLYDRVYERLLWKSAQGGERAFRQEIETRTGVVAVTEGGVVIGGGVYDGRHNIGLDEDTNGIYRAYAIAALHPGPRDVAMIGLGSGSWAQVIAHHPGVESLTIVEINEGYVESVRRTPLVRGVLENEKVTIVVDDGRRWLTSAAEPRYDVIVMNTTFHWRAGASRLLSSEFHAIARKRLKAGGMVYANTTGSEDAMRTACESFRAGIRFGSMMAVSEEKIEIDATRLARTLRTYRIEGRPAATDVEAWLDTSLPEKMSPGHTESCESVRGRTAHRTVVTDDNMATETALGRR